jgi:ankyrin repeat protein
MDIFQAITANRVDRVNQILLGDESRVNANIPNINQTPLTAAARKGSVEIGLALINHGANVNQPDANSYTPLMSAALTRQEEFVVFLLEQDGIEVNAQDRTGRTALTHAVNNEAKTIVELLFHSGADLNISNHRKYTPLMEAIDKPDILEFLLDNGADVNAQNIRGETVLCDIARSDKIGTVALAETLELLLERPDIDVDLADNTGVTPLIALIHNRRSSAHKKDAVDALLAKGADPFMRDNKGKMALDYASTDDVNANAIRDAMDIWKKGNTDALQELTGKFMVSRRLRQGTQTTTGQRLELPQRQLPEYIIRRSEYDNLCTGLQDNLTKPNIVALAKSLQIPTSNKTKSQLCGEISNKLILK